MIKYLKKNNALKFTYKCGAETVEKIINVYNKRISFKTTEIIKGNPKKSRFCSYEKCESCKYSHGNYSATQKHIQNIMKKENSWITMYNIKRTVLVEKI